MNARRRRDALVLTILEQSRGPVTAEDLRAVARAYDALADAELRFRAAVDDLGANTEAPAADLLRCDRALRAAVGRLLPSPRARMEAAVEGSRS